MNKVLFGLYLIPIWILFGSYLVWFVLIWELLWFSFVLFLLSYLGLISLCLILFGCILSYSVLIWTYLDLIWFDLDFIWNSFGLIWISVCLVWVSFGSCWVLILSYLYEKEYLNCQKKASMIMHLTKGLTSSIHENDRYRRIHVCEVGSEKDGQWSIVHVECKAQLSEAHLVALR